MTNYNELLNNIIVLRTISNEAERVYTKYPESELAERAFDEAYKAEFEAVEALAKLCAPELGGVKQARAAIWRYVDAHPEAYRDERGALVFGLDTPPESVQSIARCYYVADANALYTFEGVEYALDVEASTDTLVHFVGFGKGEELFVPRCRLWSFLPGMASEGLQIVKEACQYDPVIYSAHAVLDTH